MSPDPSQDMYQKDLMRLAADAHGAGRIDLPDASATLDNPLCGDRVTIGVMVADGHISALAQEVRACVLCQASASLLARDAVGSDIADITEITDLLSQMLKKGEPLPEGRWEALSVFEPVIGHRARFPCVLLPFETLQGALNSLNDT